MDVLVLMAFDDRSFRLGASSSAQYYIFRYCALWYLGGVYSDLTQQILVPIDTLVDASADRLVLVRDMSTMRMPLQAPSVAARRSAIQISFMAAQPRQLEYASAIRRAVENVTHRFYGSGPLDITGPVMFGQGCVRDGVVLSNGTDSGDRRGNPFHSFGKARHPHEAPRPQTRSPQRKALLMVLDMRSHLQKCVKGASSFSRGRGGYREGRGGIISDPQAILRRPKQPPTNNFDFCCSAPARRPKAPGV